MGKMVGNLTPSRLVSRRPSSPLALPTGPGFTRADDNTSKSLGRCYLGSFSCFLIQGAQFASYCV